MWWHNAIFYELYINQFGETFSGVTNKLEYLEWLGVNAVWLLPFYPSPQVDGGYDISDYMQVDSSLGSLNDFRALIAQAHKRNIHVMIDLVLNHTSDQHHWFQDARCSKSSPFHSYYLWSETATEFADAVNPLAHLKKSNWIHNSATDDYYFATFYPQQPDLNWENPRVFDEFCHIMDFWISMGVDGFRLDAISHLIKEEHSSSRNSPKTHEMVRKMRTWLTEHHPSVVLLAEASSTLHDIAEYVEDETKCHLAFNFPVTAGYFQSVALHDGSYWHKSLTETPPIHEANRWVYLLRNHDALTFENLPLAQRLGLLHIFDPTGQYCFQNQKSTAQRLASLLGGKEDRIFNAFEWLVERDGPIVLYYGDEVGLPNASLDSPVDARMYVRQSMDWGLVEQQRSDPHSLLCMIKDLLHGR